VIIAHALKKKHGIGINSGLFSPNCLSNISFCIVGYISIYSRLLRLPVLRTMLLSSKCIIIFNFPYEEALRRNFLLKHVIEGKIEETGRRGKTGRTGQL
jgi:hypothetical protein